jgi:hypothetical protein
VVAAALLIEQSDQAIEYKSGGHIVISEIYQLQHPPGIEDGQCGLANSKQFLMECCPFVKGIVALLSSVLVMKDNIFEFVLLDIFNLSLIL